MKPSSRQLIPPVPQSLQDVMIQELGGRPYNIVRQDGAKINTHPKPTSLYLAR
jgi:hypothetical protein